MASAKGVAAQRAIRPGPSLTVPVGKAVLPKVAPITQGVTNNHLANPGGGRSGLSKGESPNRGK